MNVLQRKRRRDYRHRQISPFIWVGLAMVAALFAWALVAQIGKNQLSAQLSGTRDQLAVRIQDNLNQALSGFDEMSRRSTDAQRELLPEVKRYLYAADLLNDMLRDIYGENYSLMDENLTVFQTIDDVAKGDIRNKIKDLLGAFMFGGENSAKKVKVLSGGERTRLAMIKLLLEPVNLLILDEPTNHLDMKTKDILKQALMDFDGTLIVVSHDRDFLDGLVTKVYEFGNKKVTEHLEGIYEFLQRKKMENLNELERKN